MNALDLAELARTAFLSLLPSVADVRSSRFALPEHEPFAIVARRDGDWKVVYDVRKKEVDLSRLLPEDRVYVPSLHDPGCR